MIKRSTKKGPFDERDLQRKFLLSKRKLRKRKQLWERQLPNFSGKEPLRKVPSGKGNIKLLWKLLKKGIAGRGNCRKRAIFRQCPMSFIE